ncbi:DEAD/DEAH box helicase family protein [Hymenobacter sp. B1770]|uniref:DEAD/DEAH box helicase family protein n=1 Tax=Hymenobacter sp. B1770 TaxID=1718788 RepID=UPI003CE89D83
MKDKDKSISFQKHCNTATVLETSAANVHNLRELLHALRSNQSVFAALPVPCIADAKAHGELPTVVFTGVYSTRSAAGLTSWNGVVALDLDAVKELKNVKSLNYFDGEIQKVIATLKNVGDNNQPFQLHGYTRSKSGKGLRLLYAVNPYTHNYKDVAVYYSDLYNALATVVNNLLTRNGISCFFIDDQAADISHPFALVADRYAEYIGAEVPVEILHKLLTTYTKSKTRRSGNVTESIDLQHFSSTVPLSAFQLKPGVTLTDHQTTYTVANVISYLYGDTGRALYEGLVKRDNGGQLRANWKGYYRTGLSNAAKNEASYVARLTKSISYFSNNTVKKNYAYGAEKGKVYRLTSDHNTFEGFGEKLHITKYLTERERHIVYAIKKFKRVVIKSDTGTGKTTLMKRLVNHFPTEKIDFIAPTLSIVQQQDVLQITGDKSLTDTQSGARIVATTYASINKLATREASVLVIDEAHHLLEDFTKDFREGNIKDIMNAMSRYDHVVLCTGTAHNLNFRGFQLIDVKRDTSKNIKLVEGVDIDNFLNLAYTPGQVLSNGTVLQATDTVLKTIYVTNRETGQEIRKTALRGGYRPDQVVFLHSDAKHDEVYKALVTAQVLPGTVKLLITTKLLADGVNINNRYAQVDVLFFPSRKDNLSFNEVKQYSARFRNARNLTLYTSVYAPRTVTDYHIPSYGKLAQLAHTQNRTVRESAGLEFDSYGLEAVGENVKAMQSKVDYVYFNSNTMLHEVNEVQLLRQHQLRLNMFYRNVLAVRVAVLKELGIDLVQHDVKSKYALNKEINGVVRDRNQEKKAADRANFVNLLNATHLLTDRYQKQLISQHNEMLANGFTRDSVIDIIETGTGDSIANMVRTSRYFHNYKRLKNGTKPRIGTDLDLNDVAMIAFYIQVDLYITGHHIGEFDPKDPAFTGYLNGLRRAVNAKFQSSLSTTIKPAEVVNIVKVMYCVVSSYRDDAAGKTSRYYRIVQRYKLADFQVINPIKTIPCLTEGMF